MNALCTFILISNVVLVTAAESSVIEFSKRPDAPVQTAAVTPSTGQSETDCAMKCAVLPTCSCAATAFVPETKLCLLSAVWRADFSAAAPGRPVYQKRLLRSQPIVYVGVREFVVFQQRLTGRLSFARPWAEYEAGFEDCTDSWLGLRKIHNLTGSAPKLLRVEAVTWPNVLFVSEYSGFSVGDASTNYTMTFDSYLSGSSNTSSDSLNIHKGMQFSTMDQDNDVFSLPCSNYFGNGGWWFKGCCNSNPNAVYQSSAVSNTKAMMWKGATDGQYIALKSIRLMLELA